MSIYWLQSISGDWKNKSAAAMLEDETIIERMGNIRPPTWRPWSTERGTQQQCILVRVVSNDQAYWSYSINIANELALALALWISDPLWLCSLSSRLLTTLYVTGKPSKQTKEQESCLYIWHHHSLVRCPVSAKFGHQLYSDHCQNTVRLFWSESSLVLDLSRVLLQFCSQSMGLCHKNEGI